MEIEFIIAQIIGVIGAGLAMLAAQMKEEMSEKQVSALIDLYDKQIANLRKSNELRKQKLLEYRKNMQSDY